VKLTISVMWKIWAMSNLKIEKEDGIFRVQLQKMKRFLVTKVSGDKLTPSTTIR